MFIQRKIAAEIIAQQEFFPVTTLTGPRQSGKTTLCKELFPSYRYVNMEDAGTRFSAIKSPREFLLEHSDGGNLIIDEAQRAPELFSATQVLVDEERSRRFVFTGSSNFALMRGITQSLAGRTSIFTLLPFSLDELPSEHRATATEKLIFRGSYPKLQVSGISENAFYSNYYTSYIERDLREFVNVRDLSAFEDFMRLCASSVGCEINATKFANMLGVSRETVHAWISTLEAAYLVFRLPPFFKNIRKRIVKAHKLYFYDTGLACWLLNINSEEQLQRHPLRGELFENFVISEQFKRKFNVARRPNFHFYRDNLQKEIDLIEDDGGKIRAYEIKAARTFHKDFFKNLDYFRSIFGDDIVSTQVIYDGESELNTPKNGVVNFRNI